MKKVLITMAVLTIMVAGAMVFSSFTTPKQEKSTEIMMSAPIDGPGTCVQVGNCTVSIERSGKTYTVRACNHNSYRVTVNWGAYYYVNGEPTKVGGGTLSVGTGQNCTNQAIVYSSQDGVYLDDVSVYKCD